MYRSNGSFSNSNKRYRGGDKRYNHGGNRSRSANFSRRRVATFNPSMLVKKTIASFVEPVYVAKNKFADFAIEQVLKQNILERGYETLTPIQDQIIPHILNGKDVIGLANTGTGKTAAFLIPLINKVFQQPTKKVLILAPTRELAIQIEDEFKLFARGMKLYSALCIGGAPIGRQINDLKRGADFVIATPGRLIDLEKRHYLDLQAFSAIVLDEVDQMFDMGFIHDMKYVIARLPAQRHSLFFSATLPSKLDDVAYSFLHNPVMVRAESKRTSANIEQDIIKVNGQSKIELLQDLLLQKDFEKVLVFGRTKHGLNKLADSLYQKGFRVAAIHGNKSQSQRQRALKQFKNNYVQVLLATDIASRGLDIDDVTHVINYDLPQTYEDYIHRIGRTGRANKTGVALSFVD